MSGACIVASVWLLCTVCAACRYVCFTTAWSDDRTMSLAALQCVKWTGCWVMCVTRHGHSRRASHCWCYQSHPFLSPLPFPRSFIILSYFHSTVMTHCVSQQGHVGSHLVWAKKSWILCVMLPQKQWHAFNHRLVRRTPMCHLFLL